LAYFDLNDNGKVEFEEFKKGLDKFGCVFKDNEIWALFNKYDSNGSGTLEYEEFSKSIMDIDISGLASKPNLFTETMGKNHFTITK
jgi:Ca2+-binding EF-hand superfamily protein